MNISEETHKKFEQWAQKTGIDLQEIIDMFEEKYKEIKELHPDMDDGKVERFARYQVYSELRREIASPAIWYVGVAIGVSDTRDLNARLIAEIERRLQSNPEAVLGKNVIIDETGNKVYIDLREKLPNGRDNPNYGKEIKPLLIRTAIFIARPLDEIDGEWRLAVMDLVGENVDKIPPLGQPVKFRALDRGVLEENILHLRASKVTRYIPTETELPPVIDLLRMLDEWKAEIRDLIDYHDAVADRRVRIAIVEGDVTDITTSRDGRTILRIVDETMDILDDPIMVWTNDVSGSGIDFGIGTRVIIVGTINVRTNNEGKTRASINAWSIFADPELTMPVE